MWNDENFVNTFFQDIKKHFNIIVRVSHQLPSHFHIKFTKIDFQVYLNLLEFS